ncbi:hypothetical protein RP20_CCG015281 [Aedes albopictus]|nr:hypothetical protein RP20_CCG015281 [Aedes albopictus]
MPSAAAAQSRVVTSDVIYLIHWQWLVDCGGGCIQQTVKSSSKCGVFHLERRRRRRFSIHLSGDRPTYTAAAVSAAGSKNRSIIIMWMWWLPETPSFLAGPPPPSNNKRTVTHDNDNQPTMRRNDALCAEFLLQMTVIVLR